MLWLRHFSPAGQVLVHFHQFHDDLGFGALAVEAVGGEDGEVVLMMGAAQFRRHREFVVKVPYLKVCSCGLIFLCKSGNLL